MYVLGEGEESKKWLASPGRTVEQLFLSHVTKVAKAIKKAWPHMTIVMWDDMMRDMSQDVLKGEGEIVLVSLRTEACSKVPFCAHLQVHTFILGVYLNIVLSFNFCINFSCCPLL